MGAQRESWSSIRFIDYEIGGHYKNKSIYEECITNTTVNSIREYTNTVEDFSKFHMMAKWFAQSCRPLHTEVGNNLVRMMPKLGTFDKTGVWQENEKYATSVSLAVLLGLVNQSSSGVRTLNLK